MTAYASPDQHFLLPDVQSVGTLNEGLLERVRTRFWGLDVSYQLADGRSVPRSYLDSAASTLMLQPAQQLVQTYLNHYANSHSATHISSRIASSILMWARDQILALVDAPASEYACVFAGTGATAALNKAADVFRDAHRDKEIVLISAMEHHSNDLPHRVTGLKAVHVPLAVDAQGNPGAIDLQILESLLREYSGRTAYLAITLASNVTGIVNPISEVVALAKGHGVSVLLDVAQALPHVPLSLRALESVGGVDAIAFSGHKMYAPGSPGVLIARKSLFVEREPEHLGGGIVRDVYKDGFVMIDSLPSREEAGTPNITGALALGCVADILRRIGMDVVARHENELLRILWQELSALPEVRLYGSNDLDRCPRIAIVPFNVCGLEHGLVAAILNDYHNVALRSGCFCAHPYVRELIQQDIWAMEDDSEEVVARRLGMVRVSLALYSSREDIRRLVAGVRDVIANKDAYRALYRVNEGGDFEHVSFRCDDKNMFDPTAQVTRLLKELPR